MDITPDLVERVARARYATIHGNDGMPWADQCANIRRMFNEMSHVWLQAAADAGILTGHAYRAEYDSIPLGTYTTRAAAEQACEDDLTKAVDLDGATLTWIPDKGEADDTEVSEMTLLRGPDDEEPTNYSVTPFELQPAFDPTAEG